MNDDYLWSGTGEPNPEVKRLESLLSRFQHRGEAFQFPLTADVLARPRVRWKIWVPSFAAAALALAAAIWLAPHFSPDPRWQVVRVEGSVKLTDAVAKPGARIAAGKSIETGEASHITLQVDGLGRVDLGPNTRLSLLQTTRQHEEARLDQGTIHAQVIAPPYVFLVHTPAAYALDMGCAYTLQVNPDGSGILEVTEGWIQFQHGWIQSMVPAGADAEMRPGFGPGAPFFADASEKFRNALEIVNFDFAHPQARSDALTIVLAEARKRDAFTVLNLLHRVEPEDRGRVYDRLAGLLPLPSTVTRQEALDGNWNAFSPVWDELGLGHPKKGRKSPPRIEE